MRKILKYNFLFLLVLISVKLTGQENNMLKHFLTVDEGLSHNEVTSIIQDDDGFIWVGTRGGLNRYDGYKFKIFNQVPEDSNSLVNPSIETLFTDSKGNIWIGTKSGGVSKYNPKTGQFKNIVNNYRQSGKILPSNRILSFYEDEKGRIWIGTWNRGLIIYDEETETAKHYLNEGKINSIIGTSDNRVWVGIGERLKGLYEYIPEEDSFLLRANKPCRDIAYDEARNVLWIVGRDNPKTVENENGLTKFDLRNNKTINYTLEGKNINDNKVSQIYYPILLDASGNIWLSIRGRGLYKFIPERNYFEHYSINFQDKPAGNDYNDILAIFEDKDKNIWIGTNGGGVCILTDELGFNTIGYSAEPHKGLVNTRIMSVLEDSGKNLWIGTVGDGLLWSPDRLNFYNVKHPSLKNKERFFVIRYLYEDNSGKIWIGSNLGTYFIRFVDGNPTMIKMNFPHHDNIAISFLNTENMFWIGTIKHGLFLLSQDNMQLLKHYSIKNYEEEGGIKSNRISILFQDSRERIWIGTYNGLYTYNEKDSTVHIAENYYSIDGKLTGNIITSIDEDLKGNLWIGTPNGLNKLSHTGNGKFTIDYYTEKDGVASNFIKGIARDMQGNTWFSTNVGITKFSAQESRFINFNETDGVLGKNFIEASVFRNNNGEIFFGGTKGVTWFNPDEIKEHPLTLKPVLTGLNIFNQPVEIGKTYDSKVILEHAISETDEIELSYNQNKLKIEFSALDFVSHGTNQYEYFLENFDKTWNKIGNQRFVTLNNLKPGQYNLYIKSSNRHNVWNEEPASLSITIRPPIWRTWYSLIVYILIAIGIVAVIRWNAVKQVNLVNSLEVEKMKHEQKQRINEMKLRFFTNISHEFRTPLTLIQAPLKEIISKKEKYNLNDELTGKIKVVQHNSLRLMKLVDQLLDFRKVESGNMKLYARLTDFEEFTENICRSFYELAEINNIKFSFKSALKTKDIWFDPGKVEIILNNLISNSFKSIKENGEIEVSLFEEEDQILLSVSDNGPGIPSIEIKHIFERFYRIEKNKNSKGSGIGLALTKQFVDLHKGSIDVISEPGINTEFVVSFKKGKGHLSSEEIVDGDKNEIYLAKTEPAFRLMPSETDSKSDLSILVVDDSPEIRNYLFDLLKPLYSVYIATNGQDALERTKELIPDLIISDLIMPKMDGFELCKKIRSNDKTTTTPLIFLTAKEDEHSRLLGTQAGANDYIAKPFDPDLLLAKIENIITQQKTLQKQYGRAVRLEPTDVEITSGEEEFISKVISIIENNLQNEQFSSEMLASELNRSYSSLYRKLVKLTGSSTAEFIRSIRIKKAALLMANKEKTISEVAYEVGFNHVRHFRTVFQKYFDCSPSEYRSKL